MADTSTWLTKAHQCQETIRIVASNLKSVEYNLQAVGLLIPAKQISRQVAALDEALELLDASITQNLDQGLAAAKESAASVQEFVQSVLNGRLTINP